MITFPEERKGDVWEGNKAQRSTRTVRRKGLLKPSLLAHRLRGLERTRDVIDRLDICRYFNLNCKYFIGSFSQ